MVGPITSSFLKIYLWSSISIVSGLFSMLIVIPRLTVDLELYGIYSVCLGITIYLSYSDLGFISAGMKFAAEAYAKNDTQGEISTTGFSIFILIMMFIPFSILTVYLANYPEALLNNISYKNREIAKNLLLIVGILLPIQVILERTISSILQIRLKDFIAIRIYVLINIIKIFSVFFFFTSEKYMLTEYYFFITMLSIIGSLFICGVIKFTIDYDFLMLLKKIKFQSKAFKVIGNLAFSSFFLTVSFVIYFQLDSIIIAKLISVEAVAIFAIGFTLLNFVKSLMNIFYSPFSHRLNHLSGTGDCISDLIERIIEYTVPVYIITILVLGLSAEYLVIFWVGIEYESSIKITQLLMASLLFNVLNTPASFYYNTALKYKYHYALTVFIPIIFVIVIASTYKIIGIEAFAWSKIIVGGFISLVAIFSLKKLVNFQLILKRSLLPIFLVLMPIIWLYPKYLKNLFPIIEKNSQDLILMIIVMAILISLSCILVIGVNSRMRQELLRIFTKKRDGLIDIKEIN